MLYKKTNEEFINLGQENALFQLCDELLVDKSRNSDILYSVVKTKLQTTKILTRAGTALSK